MKKINIVIVGLGLIGGSLAKSLSAWTEHTILGIESDSKSLALAIDEGSVVRKASERDILQAEVVILGLHANKTIQYLRDNWHKLNPNGIIMDTCGIKGEIYRQCSDLFDQKDGPTFIGTHPMAGRELFGYEHSLRSLFEGASLLLTLPNEINPNILELIDINAKLIGFDRIIITTPEKHDRIIAYTSQLAHVVSSAYIKSPTVEEEAGFSAGSFRDMTRVARLDEKLWSELFLMNKSSLVSEIDILIDNLTDLREAIYDGDLNRLQFILLDGRIRKEWSNTITKTGEDHA